MELTAQDWDRAHAIARELAVDVDRNELGKAVTFFRLHKDKEKFLKLLERLPRSEYIRSGRTRGYFERIHRTCRRYLAGADNERALRIVSWAFRLMTYYEAEAGERPRRTARRR